MFRRIEAAGVDALITCVHSGDNQSTSDNFQTTITVSVGQVASRDEMLMVVYSIWLVTPLRFTELVRMSACNVRRFASEHLFNMNIRT